MDEASTTSGGLAQEQRTYYDHEPIYRAIAEAGGGGWSDLPERCYRAVGMVDGFTPYAALGRFLDSRWAPPTSSRALDLGCGAGQGSLKLARRGYEAIGVDFAETAIELADQHTRRADIPCEFVRADALDLDMFDADSFGLVVDNHCLECLVEPVDRHTFLRAVSRLLESGGLFFSVSRTREGTFDPEAFDVDPDTHVAGSGMRIWKSKLELDDELHRATFNVVHSYSERQPAPLGYSFVNYALAR